MTKQEPPRGREALDAALGDMPAATREILVELLQSLIETVGADLRSVLLFGSAAEGRLRATSDVNLLVLASQLSAAQLDALRAPSKAGRAAAGAAILFLESAEFSDACESFAMKFADMKARHRVLYGENPFAAVEIPRGAAIRQLRQVLLNLKLRLRERYVLEGDQGDRLALALADMTGPLRVGAATLLALRDGVDRPPKLALQEFCAEPRWADCLEQLSAVHRAEALSLERLQILVGSVLELLAALAAAAGAL